MWHIFNIKIGRKKLLVNNSFWIHTQSKYKNVLFNEIQVPSISNCILYKYYDSFKPRILDVKKKCVCKWQKENQLIPGQDAVSLKKNHTILMNLKRTYLKQGLY